MLWFYLCSVLGLTCLFAALFVLFGFIWTCFELGFYLCSVLGLTGVFVALLSVFLSRVFYVPCDFARLQHNQYACVCSRLHVLLSPFLQ